jgi:hypothetical protein
MSVAVDCSELYAPLRINLDVPASALGRNGSNSYAVLGQASGLGGYGVYGTASDSYGTGVYGSSIAGGVGVQGVSNFAGYGIYGQATGSGGYAVYADASGSSGIGLYSECSGTGCYAAEFGGAVAFRMAQ